MDEKTLTALKESIAHWERNVAAETPAEASTLSDDCALCDLFCPFGLRCNGCPVREKTGMNQCRDTPFYDAHEAHLSWQHADGTRENWQLAAQRELDFLKSLLPTEGQ